MDISLMIFVVVTAFFTFRGYRQGLLSALSRVLGLLAGYGAAIFYAEPVARIIEADYPLQAIAAFITASVVLFIGAGMVVSALFWIIEKLLPQKENRSAASRTGGALVGMAVGVVLAIAVIWSFAFVRDMRSVAAPGQVAAAESPSPNAGDLPGRNSAVERFVQQAAGKVVDTAMSAVSAKPPVAKLSAALVRAPAETAMQMQRLTQSGDLQQLLNSPENQAVLNSGSTEAVRQLPAFQQLVNNPDMIALARAAGMLDERAVGRVQMETVLAGQVTDIWARVQRVKDDDRVQAIINDPEFQQGIQSGNPMALLTNPKLLEFADIVFSDELASEGGDQYDSTAPEHSIAPEKETRIFRWVDENGRVHFSDKEAAR